MQEYDDEDSGEDQFDGPPPNRGNKNKNRRRYKKPPKKKPSTSEEEDDDDAFGGFSMPNVGKYFKKTINTISDYIPPMPFAGEEDDDDDENDDDDKDDDDDDSIDKDDDNNASIRRPKFKYTLRKVFRRPLQLLRPDKIDGTKRKRWYDKFFFGSDDDSQSKDSSESSTEQTKFMDWFRLNSEVSTERSVAIPTQSTTPQSLLYSFIGLCSQFEFLSYHSF